MLIKLQSDTTSVEAKEVKRTSKLGHWHSQDVSPKHIPTWLSYEETRSRTLCRNVCHQSPIMELLGVHVEGSRGKKETNSLWIRPTDALNYSFVGITTLHVSGSLSAHHQEFLAVHRLWYIFCSCDDRLLPGAGWNAVPSCSW